MKKFQFTALVRTPVGACGTLSFVGTIEGKRYIVTTGDNKQIVANTGEELLTLLAKDLHVDFLEYTAPESCLRNVREVPVSNPVPSEKCKL